MWQALKDLEESFPGRKYSDAQKKIFMDLISKYGEDAFTATAQNFIAKGNKRPLPVDFTKAMTGMKRKDAQPKAADEHRVNCSKCHDTGYAFVHVDGGFEFTVVACNCNEGIWVQLKEKSALPRLETSMTLKPFPVQAFKHETIQEGLDWWQNVKEISRAYWDNPGQEPREQCSLLEQNEGEASPW